MGASTSSTLSDSELVTHALKSGVKVFAGFKAEERRLVWVYGDSFKSSPNLVTILPTGVTEGPSGGKKLSPTKEKGLVTYPCAQFLSHAEAEPHLGTHFVWQADADRYALAQLWTINYNDEFRKVFKESLDNPNPEHFDPEAVDNLYKAVVPLFGEQARDIPVKYCAKSTQNIDRTYVGNFEQLNKFLNIPGVKESLDIQSVSEDEIKVRTLDKKGNAGSQVFPYGRKDGVEQVLYKRNGFTSFMCIKSRAQFELDCFLHGEITA